MMRSRGAMSIQFNYMIIVILTAIAMVFGFLFMLNFLSSGNKAKDIITSEIKLDIESRLKTTGKVAILPDFLEKKEDTIYIGIRNVFNDSRKFVVNFSINKYVINEQFMTPMRYEELINSSELKIKKFFINRKILEKKIDEFPIFIIVNVYHQNIDGSYELYHQGLVRVE
ncbi:MAG: hypothetical protein QXD62_00510 [Candidatus Woesearchaeota archaeon]